MVNILAPAMFVQYRNNFTPYYTPQIVENLNISKQLLDKAIEWDNAGNWVEFKNFRNANNKIILENKKIYTEKKFRHY